MINPELKPVFRTDISVRWCDMDALGHVNNVVYLSYMEETRVQLLNRLGHSIEDPQQGPVVVRVDSEFLQPIVYPDHISVECRVDQAGRSSFMTYYRLFSHRNLDAPICLGSAKVVWINRQSGRSMPLPDSIRRLVDTQKLPPE